MALLLHIFILNNFVFNIIVKYYRKCSSSFQQCIRTLIEASLQVQIILQEWNLLLLIKS